MDEWSGDIGVGAHVLLAAVRFPPGAQGRHRNSPRHHRRRKAQVRPGKAGSRARRRSPDLAEHGHLPGLCLAHYADFYDIKHVLILGRCTSGRGGELILDGANQVLQAEFPELAPASTFNCPMKRAAGWGSPSPPPASRNQALGGWYFAITVTQRVPMQTYLERYLQGEHLAVWAELVGLGPTIRKEPLYTDALAVAREMMTRARHNVSLLVERLKTIGYRFVESDRVWVLPDAKHLSALNALEQRFGPFPLSIRMWCGIVGSVNFMGAHPKLSQCHDYDWGG